MASISQRAVIPIAFSDERIGQGAIPRSLALDWPEVLCAVRVRGNLRTKGTASPLTLVDLCTFSSAYRLLILIVFPCRQVPELHIAVN